MNSNYGHQSKYFLGGSESYSNTKLGHLTNALLHSSLLVGRTEKRLKRNIPLSTQGKYHRQGHWTSFDSNLNVKCIWELVSYILFFVSDTDKIVRSNDIYLSSPNECKDAFGSDIYVSVSVHCFFQNCSVRYNSAVVGFSPHVVSAMVHLLLDFKKKPKSTLTLQKAKQN